jgi:OHCU decarboxylase
MSGAALAAFNALPEREAESMLLDCCGSRAWAARMTERRPYDDEPALLRAADDVWNSLPPSEWLTAFRHHPRIGESRAAAGQSQAAQAMSAGEQERVQRASRELRATLADANASYEQRFGFIFIICAQGRRTEEILSALTLRMRNDPETELRVAAEEQRRITQLRLAKLLHIDS